ncbi:MAG: RDD family protein [Bacteroidota bacterium]
MKNIDIVTSHNITIEYQLAGVLDRFFALLVDLAILFAWLIFVSIIAGDSRSEDSVIIIFMIFFMPVFFCYHLTCEIFFGGQSIGKRALGIKVVRLDGKNPTISDCFMRWVFRIVDIFFTLGALAALFASASDKGQRLGDMIAGTVVVKLNPTNRYTINDILSIRDSATHGETLYPQVTKLTDDDMLLIKNALERYKTFPNPKTGKLIRDITEKVCSELQISEIPKDKPVFLRKLLQDYIVLTR